MEDKIFGLPEAQKLAALEKVSVPAVLAVLEILGIPNLVGQQAKAAIDACQVAIRVAMGTITNARAHEEKETVRIREAIVALNKELTTIVIATTGVEGSQGEVVKLNEKEIATIAQLAKKFG